MNETAKDLPFHFEASARLNAPAGTVFAYLDDHQRLSAHMSQRSWMMAGGRMKLELDAAQGPALGSRIRLSGRVLGIPLAVEEVVTNHVPPLRKLWETIGTPKLLVIGHYRMGFEILPQGSASHLRIFIDYALPESALENCLGRMFGNWYARWCAQRMVSDVEENLCKVPVQ